MPRRGSSCSADHGGGPRRPGRQPLGRLRRRRARERPSLCQRAVVGLVAALLVLIATPAGAESPVEVAEDLAVDGVFVAPGRTDLDEVAIAESIRQARARGLRLVVVAPNDPQPDASAFARRVLEASDADAALVFPTEGGLEAHVIDEFDSASLRALGAGRSKSNPVAAVEAFTDELLVQPATSVPPIVGQVLRIVLLLAVVLAGAVAIEQLLRRMFGRGRSVRADHRAT
ncbi:MAG: hypothetical protein OEV40_23460 [Acidimicrobiia bacterium]|nr:hypothetical protein [Acidimicrobiia bacterium]